MKERMLPEEVYPDMKAEPKELPPRKFFQTFLSVTFVKILLFLMSRTMLQELFRMQ